MSFSTSNKVVPFYSGGQVPNPADVIVKKTAPPAAVAGSPVSQAVGTIWINVTTGNTYQLVQNTTAAGGIWTLLGGAAGAVATINSLAPTAGNIIIAGTANQITATSAVSTITLSIPVAFTAPGSIASTTSITAGNGLTVTTGNLGVSAGSISASTTVTAGTGITATTGNIAASAGAVSASTTVTAGTNLVATAGSVSAGTTVTGGTGLIATSGGVTATAGDIVATAGNISTTVGSITSATTLTATSGNITATNGDFVSVAADNGFVAVATTVAGATPVVNNVRHGRASFTDVINAGAVGALVCTNSIVSAASIIMAQATCATVGSAVAIRDYVPGAGTVTFNVTNLGGTNTGANIFIDFWVVN